MPTFDVDDLDWYFDNVVVPSGIERRKVGPVLAWQGSWIALEHRLRASAEDDSPLAAAIRLALGQGFALTRAQARVCGLPDATVRRLVYRGEWTSCGHGSVAVVAQAADANPYAAARRRHALSAVAAARRRAGHVVGGASAAILHGLPVLATPELPEFVAPKPATTGRCATARVRSTHLEPIDRDDWFGVPETTVARTVVDVARADPCGGLMAADAALSEGLLCMADLAPVMRRSMGLPGIRRAREVLSLASARIKSPLESITRLALHDAGFPPPELQFEIRGADGKRYWVDFAWPEIRLVLEADGRGKYTDDALWREKKRELALIRAGYRIARVSWSDVLTNWPATCAWLRELMAAGRWG